MNINTQEASKIELCGIFQTTSRIAVPLPTSSTSGMFFKLFFP